VARRKTSGIAGRYTAMTVKVREWKKGKQVGFEVDIRFTYPDGAPLRRRIKAPVESKSAAKRWGEAKERELLIRPSPILVQRQEEQRKEVPTLREFAPRVIAQHARANRQKASTIHAKERIFENHLHPALGHAQLDRITDELVQRLKSDLSCKAPKTVNNILTVLGKTLRLAVKWKEIGTMPCTIELLRVSNVVPVFYEFADYRCLVEAAQSLDPRALLVVLLGGDAGLRASEMMGLRGEDVDLRRGQLVIERAVWRDIVDSPKSGRGRIIPMTDALAEAFGKVPLVRGASVLLRDDGDSIRRRDLSLWLRAAQRQASVTVSHGPHVLRHTFCSHLAMRGAPAKAIQELAGHTSLTTTLRYMHLSPSERQGAIRLLNRREEGPIFGDIVETARAAE
jgi:integrase